MSKPDTFCTIHRVWYAQTCEQCEPPTRRRAITPKQRELLPHLLDGLCTKQCAERMGIAEGTVKIHRADLYRRLGVKTHEQLMAKLMTPTREAVRLMEGR